MHYKITVSRAVFMSFAVVLLVLISLVCLAPLWHVLMGSLSNPTQVGITQGLILYPLQNLDTHAYSIILTYQRLWNGYLNTFIYIFLQCVLTGVATIVAGYVFSRNRFRFRNTFMLIISSTMLFNGGMIPMYMVVRSLGLLDTRWAIVVPGMLSVFNIIIMRTAMQGISDALEEAARLDGANDFTIMFRIILPLCKSTFAVIMLFSAVAKWNDFMSALMYLPTRTDLYPLQMVLRDILMELAQVKEPEDIPRVIKDTHTGMVGNRALCELVLRAGHAPAYLYVFDHDLPGNNDGSFHSSELWYVFGTFERCWRPMTGTDFELSRAMTAYWANFAKRKNPNGEKLPTWKPYTETDRENMLFQEKPHCEQVEENPLQAFVLKYIMED